MTALATFTATEWVLIIGAIQAALVIVAGAIAAAVVTVVNALHSHGQQIAANTAATNANTAALQTPPTEQSKP